MRMATWTTLTGLVLALIGCTDSRLQGIPVDPIVRDDKLEISGSFCTEDPSTLLFPVRVLIMVDGSVSMDNTDPPNPVTLITKREEATREVISTLLADEASGVAIALMRFTAEAQILTFADENGNNVQDPEEGYFTRSRSQLVGDGATGGVVEALDVTDRTSNFIAALAVAYTTLRDEMERADETSLPLSKYVIIFMSDFQPQVEGEETEESVEENVLDSVDTIIDLGKLFRVGHLEMNFVYISTATDVVDRKSENLGRLMAVHGDGAFRSFPNNEELNFLFVDLNALRRVFTLNTMVAVNTSSVSRGIGSCGDGVDRHLVTCPLEFDRIEAATCCQPGTHADPTVGTSLTNWSLDDRRTCCDRDHDGFESPWCGGGDCDDWHNQNFPGATLFLPDSDGDGVCDEDELRIQSDPLVPDSDGDGFSDLLEYRFRTSGLDPLDPYDADCLAGEISTSTLPCNDGVDNDTETDNDGEFIDIDGDDSIDVKLNVDATDVGCMTAFDEDETDGTIVVECTDTLDNDGDNWVDAADPECQNGVAESGFTDFQCNDGLDNDGDGDIDSDDEGCASAIDDLEQGIAYPACRDDEDNDNDGWINGADPDCVYQEHLRDNDGDGLGNCEERFFGTSRNGADTDADGIPDPVEIRFNISAVKDDLLDDYDRDQTGNGDEVRLGTDPRFNDAGGRARNSYRYSIDEIGLSRRAAEIGGYTLHICNDGKDNDGDGQIDSEDTDCLSPLQETETAIDEPTCTDGQDNDGDGWIDMEDVGCLRNEPEISLGTTHCNDGLDNNIDGFVDEADEDCLSGFQNTEEPILEESCLDVDDDGEPLDNDNDGWANELDPDCAVGRREAGLSEHACNNGRDDDEDGMIDAFDADCISGHQMSEETIDPTCVDGDDNDGDGWIDALDPSCALGRPEYATGYECNDGFDNDEDGAIDSDDPDCLVAVGGREARTTERNCIDGVDNDGDGWMDGEDPECLAPGSRSCYEFNVDNVTLTQTIGPGFNRILIYAGQVPFDDPESFSRYLVACVEARYICSNDPERAAQGLCDTNSIEPPSGRYQVDPEQFVPLNEFDPRIHCQEIWEGI